MTSCFPQQPVDGGSGREGRKRGKERTKAKKERKEGRKWREMWKSEFITGEEYD